MWLHDLWVLIWPGGTFISGFTAIWPNIAATMILAPIAWFWKIRPHLRRLHAKHAQHSDQLAALHAKIQGKDDPT